MRFSHNRQGGRLYFKSISGTVLIGTILSITLMRCHRAIQIHFLYIIRQTCSVPIPHQNPIPRHENSHLGLAMSLVILTPLHYLIEGTSWHWKKSSSMFNFYHFFQVATNILWSMAHAISKMRLVSSKDFYSLKGKETKKPKTIKERYPTQ